MDSGKVYLQRRYTPRPGHAILTGAVLVRLLGMGMLDGSLSPARVAAIGAYALAMLGVCVLACIVPTRQAMAIEPTEAMQD